MSKAQELATLLDKEQIDTVRRDVMNHEAATLLRTQDALLRQALEALHRVDAVERGMGTTKGHHYAAREETTNAITAIKEHLK